LDRQRDDRLGRKFHFEHWREILRGPTGTHANTNSDGIAYSNCDSDTITNTYAYSIGNSKSYSDRHSYCAFQSNSNWNTVAITFTILNTDRYANTETFTDAEIRANAQAACHAATAPVAIRNEKEAHRSTPTSRREHAKSFGVRSFELAGSNMFGAGFRTGNVGSRKHYHGCQHKRQRSRLVASGAC
jgi:hypothetical protein